MTACKKEVSHDCLRIRAWGKIRDNRAKKARVFLTLVVALDTAHDFPSSQAHSIYRTLRDSTSNSAHGIVDGLVVAEGDTPAPQIHLVNISGANATTIGDIQADRTQ